MFVSSLKNTIFKITAAIAVVLLRARNSLLISPPVSGIHDLRFMMSDFLSLKLVKVIANTKIFFI